VETWKRVWSFDKEAHAGKTKRKHRRIGYNDFIFNFIDIKNPVPSNEGTGF
jgi:hypothetical protein